MGLEGSPVCSSVQLWRISHGDGKLGPIGVDQMVLSRWSIEILEALVAVREDLWF